MCECTWSVNCDYVLFCCFVLFFRLGESCSHVGAVVFKLDACVCLGYNKVTYTSVACAWNGVSTKKNEAAMIKDILQQAHPKKRSVRNQRPIPKASASQQNQLLQMLSNTKESHANVFTSKPWYNNLEGFTEEQCSQVEEETKGQAACIAWHQHRVGRITCSTAHKVLHTSLETPSQTLINDICSSNSSVTLRVSSWQWGKEHEVDAMDTYKYALSLCSATSNTSRTVMVTCRTFSRPTLT